MKVKEVGLEINFVELKQKNLKGYTLIEGFPGLGLVGTIAAKYLVERLKLEEIGYIESNAFTPIIRIHKGQPVRPVRIHISEKHKLVVIISEQIIPTITVNKLAKSLINWVEQKGIKKVISIAGIKDSTQTNNNKIYGISCCSSDSDLLKEHKVQLIEDGITTGVAAMILLELKNNPNVDGYSLLGNAKLTADYNAAAESLKKLDEIIGLNLDIIPLLKEAKETQGAIMKQIEKMKKTHKSVEELNEGLPMYT